uniref:Uncharacterized protein n=1 Tax=Anopheles melas TaxID=34690 RepID=A0A182TET5_9DIPT
MLDYPGPRMCPTSRIIGHGRVTFHFRDPQTKNRGRRWRRWQRPGLTGLGAGRGGGAAGGLLEGKILMGSLQQLLQLQGRRHRAVAILDSFRTEGEWAYGMTLRSSSSASFRSCIRRRSRALMFSRTDLPWRFFCLPPAPGGTGTW